MKTMCPNCKTLYDDARITPGMVIHCAKCNQNFQAFPPINVLPAVVEETAAPVDKSAPPAERSSYMSNLIIVSITKYAAQGVAFITALASMELFLLFFLAPGVSILCFAFLLIFLATLCLVHSKIAGESPGIKWPALIGFGISFLAFLIKVGLLRQQMY